MKKYTFIFCIILAFLPKLNAQFTTPFPDTSASWTSMVSYYDAPNWYYSHSRNIVTNDTLIDTLMYHQLAYSDNPTDTTFNGIWKYRIDSLKVFFLINDTTEILRYDFGMSIGDSILHYSNNYIYLDSIDTETIYSGQTLSRYNFHCNTCWGFSDVKWYYGIGSNYAPLLNQDPWSFLTSFYYNNECYIFFPGFIFNPAYDSTLCISANLLEVEENSNGKNSYSIYPNPSSGKFNIEFENTLSSSIEIYDLTGHMVFQELINSKITEININLSAGIYFLKILNENFISTKKLIIE